MKKFNLLSIILLLTCFVQAQVGINTENPEATLHVNGNLKITDTPILTSSTSLVVDTDGNVGTAASIPARVMLVQSTRNQMYSKKIANELAIINQLNQGNPITVMWDKEDILTNNILSYNEADNSFSFSASGIYEISGYVNYNPNAEIPQDPSQQTIHERFIILNVTIQKLNTNNNNWEDLASARYAASDVAIGPITATIIIPPVLYSFQKNDKIRMVIIRPKGMGTTHGTGNQQDTMGINAPTGIKFSKGMKVIAY